MSVNFEILAPAGNEEMLRAAVFSGADAVYLGLEGFNARRSAGNFTPDTLKEAVSFCHGRGVRVHVALNTTVYTEELPAVTQAIRAAADAGVDALIVQDLGLASLAAQMAPDLPLHASTQMTVHTLAGAKKAAEMGFSRVILARELTLEEIEHIAKNCGIETECFVHGALCMSVSGQCMMSAFLGGRSGNRGSCAGPCRLPFAADGSGAAHLSLKDMSLIDYLPRLRQAGVCSAKIEGRLRTPEYVATAVTACRAALEGKAYDKQLVRDVFSRSGFTDGYLTGRRDGSMFGVRTEADTAAAKAALPRARELFRREYPRLPVDMTLTVEAEGAKLRCTDGVRQAIVYLDAQPQPAQKDQTEAVIRSLSKTGGTPFVPGNIRVEGGQWYLPGSALNEARRQALDQLLQKRSALQPWPCQDPVLPVVQKRPVPAKKEIWARFAVVEQMPEVLPAELAGLILPIAELDKVPAVWRSRTLLELPRVMFGSLEEQTARLIARAKEMGFAGFEAHNIAHFALCAGVPVWGGFGLNITNCLSVERAAALGAQGVTALPELSAARLALLGPRLPVAAIGYGHLPLMISRACPLQNVRSCAGCSKKGTLTDRKGRKFPVRCGLGVRTVYNPVPLYMGDKPDALACQREILYFTIESPVRAAKVLEMYLGNAPFDGELTRGLYFKGAE